MSEGVGPGAPVPSTPPPRRLLWWDVLLTVLFLVGMVALGIWGAFMGMLALAFMDTCPPEVCNGDLVYVRWLGGAALVLVAVTVSAILIALRRRGWWTALIGLIGMFALWGDFVVGTIAYSLR